MAAIILPQGSLKSAERRTSVAGMERPIEVDVPHRLGKEEARRRIASNVHRLEEHIPGGATHMGSSWTGDELTLDMSALGQTITATIAVEETKVRLRVMLPPMLAMFARPIESALSAKGGDLLLEDRTKR
jgi:hypothetical protein